MSGRVEFEFTPDPKPLERTTSRGPMRILVLADLSGRGNRGILEHGEGLAERPVVSVDVDNFDARLFEFAPRLHLPVGGSTGPGIALELKRLDDFHPDSLYESVELFKALRTKRERLLDPGTYQAEAEELKSWAGERTPPAAASEPAAEDDTATLERLLGRGSTDTTAVGPRPATGGVDINRLIEQIVQPHIVPETDPQQAQLVSAVDAGIGDQMRAILHHAAFQELEAAWRSLQSLVSGVETGEELKIYLLDVSKRELATDVAATGSNLQASGLHRVLVDRGARAAGGQPWSLLVGNYTFGAEPEDLALLASLGVIASHAGGPFLAAADPGILGCRSLDKNPDPEDWKAEGASRWQGWRRSPAAGWVGLALPRVLRRLPYGSRTDEIDRFEFEEMSGAPDHAAYLWGNPAFACAQLIARSYQERGWSMQPGDHAEIDDLPAHTYHEDGESRMKACAEVYLSERAGEALLNRGLMPFLSFRNRNAVRVMRFQSVADPPAGLPGSWS